MLNKKANLLSKPDAYYNIENFGTGTGKQNVLYVSGYSGGGKSTVGKQIAEQHGASYIELDALHTMKDSDKKHKIVEQYFKENPHLVKDGKGISGIDYNYKSQQFLPYLRDYVKKHPNEKFVVEGIQTLNSKDPNVPRVVKGTGLLEATRRAATRNAAQGRKGDIPLALNAYLYPQINKERKFIQNTIRNTDYAQGRLGRAQKIMDSSAKAAKKAGVAGLALAGAATLANNEINKRVKRKGDTDMRKSAYEMLDQAIEKIAKRDNKRDGNDAVRKTLGVGALGVGGTGLYLSGHAGGTSEGLDSFRKSKSFDAKLGMGSDAVVSVLRGKPTISANGVVGAVDALEAKQLKKFVKEKSKASKTLGRAGLAGAGIGSALLLAGNRNKEAFEMVEEAIEKVAERDNKRVAGNTTGAMLLGAGGTGLYYANKDKAIASQANKAAKKSFNSAVASSAATLPLAGISLKNTLSNVKGTKELAAAQAQAKNNPGLSSYRDLQKAEDKAKELVKASNKYKKTRSLASNALLANSFVEGSNFKKQTSIAEKALKNSKLKGAAGIAGLGLGAGTLLAANKKKD